MEIRLTGSSTTKNMLLSLQTEGDLAVNEENTAAVCKWTLTNYLHLKS